MVKRDSFTLDGYLVEHCSPTLASLKTASLFSCHLDSLKNLDRSITELNESFREKGVELITLKYEKGFALVYVCRRSRLLLDLSKSGVEAFLKEYGYETLDFEHVISRLKARLSLSADFPHEIGVFLGYPLDDVKGFIENAGKNSKCVGCWKVYCNECEAQKTFCKYDKCKEVYSRLWKSRAKTLSQLTVKA